MDHISANLAFSRREKNIWGYKKLQGGGGGGKKPIRKTEKKWQPFFWRLKFLWGAAKKSAGGTKWLRYATGSNPSK